MVSISKKSKDKITVRCVGPSATNVTGSGYLIECPTGEQILLDCGLYQSANAYESYKINKRKFKFKPKDITAVIISHINADHYCLLPKFVAEGGDCNIYISEETVAFTKPMLEDSANIMERDVKFFKKKYKGDFSPIYTPDDVERTLPHFVGVSKGATHKISDNVSFRLVSAGHIFGSCQIELFITLPSKVTKKICYSGDLGNIMFEQPFVEDYEPIEKCNMFIGECTYNDPKRSAKKRQREKDEQVLEDTIREVCLEKKGSVLVPTFALQRTETMLYELYKLFGHDKDFHVPILVDSPLAVKLFGCFDDNLPDDSEYREVFDDIRNWKNVKFVSHYEDTMAYIADPAPKIICSSSGMLNKGRSVLWLQNLLPKRNCCVITCGYMGEGTLGWKIKNVGKQKSLTVDGKVCPNRCKIKNLESFSSHMQYQQLMNTYVDLAKNGCETIWLVHGDSGKVKFKEELEKRIHKACKTTKVVATNKDTVARV